MKLLPRFFFPEVFSLSEICHALLIESPPSNQLAKLRDTKCISFQATDSGDDIGGVAPSNSFSFSPVGFETSLNHCSPLPSCSTDRPHRMHIKHATRRNEGNCEMGGDSKTKWICVPRV